MQEITRHGNKSLFEAVYLYIITAHDDVKTFNWTPVRLSKSFVTNTYARRNSKTKTEQRPCRGDRTTERDHWNFDFQQQHSGIHNISIRQSIIWRQSLSPELQKYTKTWLLKLNHSPTEKLRLLASANTVPGLRKSDLQNTLPITCPGYAEGKVASSPQKWELHSNIKKGDILSTDTIGLISPKIHAQWASCSNSYRRRHNIGTVTPITSQNEIPTKLQQHIPLTSNQDLHCPKILHTCNAKELLSLQAPTFLQQSSSITPKSIHSSNK